MNIGSGILAQIQDAELCKRVGDGGLFFACLNHFLDLHAAHTFLLSIHSCTFTTEAPTYIYQTNYNSRFVYMLEKFVDILSKVLWSIQYDLVQHFNTPLPQFLCDL